jgi:hypothetical protein
MPDPRLEDAEPEGYDPSGAIWGLLQDTPHFECGGWSWDSATPGILRCSCGSDVTLFADPAGAAC